MVRIVIGSVAGGLAMFIVGFLFFATPLQLIGYSSASEAQNAAAQAALAQNLPGTGTYIVPSPMSAQGAVLYGKGPVALVHYNSEGFSTSSMTVVVAGLIQEIIVALILGLALLGIATRVTDFASHARLVVWFSVGATALTIQSGCIRIGAIRSMSSSAMSRCCAPPAWSSPAGFYPGRPSNSARNRAAASKSWR
jgi:hypothetical protein